MSRLLLNGEPWMANAHPLRAGFAPLVTVADWTHSWDVFDATVTAGRVTRVPNRSDADWPLLADGGIWGGLLGAPTLPGPVYSASDSRFGGRPSAHFDSHYHPALFSILATTLDPSDDDTLFGDGQGYDMPYVIACLARPIDIGGYSIWDSNREGAPTLSTGLLDQTKWGGTTGLPTANPDDVVLDLWPVTTIARSTSRTVLAIYYFNAAGSWIEIAERTAAGPVTRTRQAVVFTDRNPSADPTQAGFREGFMGFVSSSYWSAAAIKLGAVDEADITALVAWASPFLPVG